MKISVIYQGEICFTKICVSTYLGLPFTTLTVTSTPLSSTSTHGPALSNQTSITLNLSAEFLLKFFGVLALPQWLLSLNCVPRTGYIL